MNSVCIVYLFYLLTFDLRMFYLMTFSFSKSLWTKAVRSLRKVLVQLCVLHGESWRDRGFFMSAPLLPPTASLQRLPRWGCLPSLNKAGISPPVNSEAEATEHKTEMGCIFRFPSAAYASRCRALPARLPASASLCFRVSIHSCPKRENVLSPLIISFKTETNTHVTLD